MKNATSILSEYVATTTSGKVELKKLLGTGSIAALGCTELKSQHSEEAAVACLYGVCDAWEVCQCSVLDTEVGTPKTQKP